MNTTIRTILTSTAAAAFLGSLHAADATPAKPPADPGKYDLKKKSTFTLASDRRAPFWQIGWVKNSKEVRTEIAQAPKPKIDESAFNVTSILLGNPSLAVVNGRAYSEGELLRMPKGSGSPPVKIRVQQIGDGSVTLGCDQHTFTVTLKRPELAARKAEELLDQEN